jgi:murein DD-endopeptidase MepM/ murein hydrolase activator NlpD
MRTYQSGTKEKNVRKNNKKLIYSILLAVSLAAIATVITLSVVLGGPKPLPVLEEPDPSQPVDTVPDVTAPEFKAPLASFTVTAQASLTRLVYSSSMNYWKTHNGVDLAAEAGATVMSVSAGTVTSVQHTVLEGSVVAVTHGDGLVSYYKGLDSDVSVSVGDAVSAGTRLGTLSGAGMALEHDEGPHLHLEMKLNGKFVDPAVYLPELADK